MIKRIEISFPEWCAEVIESMDEYVFIDTETTGFNGDIVELSIVGVRGKVKYNSLLRPCEAISEGAMAVHHITEAMVSNAPTIEEKWPEISYRIRGKKLIAWNYKFDEGRLKYAMAKHGIPAQEFEGYCAMLEYSDFYGEPGHYRKSYKWQKLEDALYHQNILLGEQKHRALWDAQATLEVIRAVARKA